MSYPDCFCRQKLSRGQPDLGVCTQMALLSLLIPREDDENDKVCTKCRYIWICPSRDIEKTLCMCDTIALSCIDFKTE
jgi:hypothetical protein